MGKYLNDFKKEYNDVNLYPYDEAIELESKQRQITCKEYGFDVRDTFNLNNTFICWLYERLKYYLEIGGKTINLKCHFFNIDDKKLTQEECVKRMISDCEVLMLAELYADKKTQEKYDNAKNDLFKTFSEVFWTMWW